MFGIRLVPLLGRRMPSILAKPCFVPKYEYSLINRQTTNSLLKTSVLPNNLMIRNLIEMLQKMNEQTEPDLDNNITNLSLLNQGTLRMSHLKICLQA